MKTNSPQSIRRYCKAIVAFFLLFATTSFLISCAQDEDFLSNSPDASQSVNSSANNVMAARNGQLSNPNNLASVYVNNVKTLMYASNAIELSSEDLERLENEEDKEKNPMITKLKSLEILDEDLGREVNFYDLPLEQRRVFVDKLLDNEASDITKKLEQVPQAAHDLSVENAQISELINELNLTKLSVGTESTEKVLLGRNSDQSIKKVDSEMLFRKLGERLAGGSTTTNNGYGYTTFGASVSFNYPKVPVERVKEAWIRHARRGDFIVALPVHHAPWIYANIGENVKFKVGHAGIISRNITHSTGNNSSATIECHLEGGVQNMSIAYWNTPHYIMGIKRTIWKWRWRGFRSGFYREDVPVSNPGALADWANSYHGRGYVYGYEFLTAKWAAPSRFTCTTLVWYCSKRAYDINVSSWYATLVTPSGLLTDSNTYIRAVVQ